MFRQQSIAIHSSKNRTVFSFFKKSEPSIPYSDKVWKRSEYARKGLFMMAMMRLQGLKSCLIVSFFESETQNMIEFMNEHKLDFVQWDESISSQPTAALCLVQAKDLSKPTLIHFLKSNTAKFSGEALFAGHYPIQATEQVALKNLAVAGFSKFVFCISFEDPLLKLFGSQNILPLLEKLGLEEEEAIEHNMVTQSVKRAREKVESGVKKEIPAKSPEEWFLLNVKK